MASVLVVKSVQALSARDRPFVMGATSEVTKVAQLLKGFGFWVLGFWFFVWVFVWVFCELFGFFVFDFGGLEV